MSTILGLYHNNNEPLKLNKVKLTLLFSFCWHSLFYTSNEIYKACNVLFWPLDMYKFVDVWNRTASWKFWVWLVNIECDLSHCLVVIFSPLSMVAKNFWAAWWSTLTLLVFICMKLVQVDKTAPPLILMTDLCGAQVVIGGMFFNTAYMDMHTLPLPFI